MQGRPGPDKQHWDDKQTEARLAALRATNRHRAISPHPPQRPAGMTRLNTAPEETRVPRPQRRTVTPKKTRRRLAIIGTIFVIAAVFAWFVGSNLATGISQSQGAASTVANFFDALSSQNYKQAYQDLGPSITLKTDESVFTNQAKELDTRYGKIVDYTQDADSALFEDGKQSYTYTITRENYETPYKIRLTLQEVNEVGWRIINYGNTLGPTQ